MKASIIAVVGLAALGGAAAFAAERGEGMRGGMMGPPPFGMDRGGGMGAFSPEDREAFTDARLAAMRAGLRLSADQEKMWPPVEDAIRGLVRLRRDERRAWRETNPDARQDIPGMLRAAADRQAARADALRKLADASAPLYASLDEGQKRRLHVLARSMRPHFGMRGGMDGMRPHGGGPREDFDRR